MDSKDQDVPLQEISKVEDLGNIKMRDAMKLCDKYGIPCDELETLEDLKEVIIEYLESKDEKVKDKTDETNEIEAEAMLKEIISNDADIRRNLQKIYDDITRIVKDPTFDSDLKKELQASHDDYEESLTKHRKELENKQCHIVLTGEVSAGKSSFLNLLLGKDILPTAHVRCTSVIIQIHNSGSSTPRFVVSGKNVETKEIEVSDEDDLKKKLEPYTTFTSPTDEPTSDAVDIYWPVEMLQDNVTIVDTPGIEDNKELMEKLLRFLKTSIATIYILNAANAGGIQVDRIEKIFAEQSKWFQERKMNMYDPRLALFVCNKWDGVKKSEEDSVWKFIIDKLHSSWPELLDNQVIRFSVEKEQKRVEKKRKHTKEFHALISFIKRMVPLSLEANVKRHAVWLKDFLGNIDNSTAAKLHISTVSKNEKAKILLEAEANLKELEAKKKKQHGILLDIEEQFNQSVNRLYEHLNSDDVQADLASWSISDCPKFSGSSEEVGREANELISRRIEREIRKWAKDNPYLEPPQSLVSYREDLLIQANKLQHILTGFGMAAVGMSMIQLGITLPSIITAISGFMIGSTATASALGFATFGLGLLIGAIAYMGYKIWGPSNADMYIKKIPGNMSIWTKQMIRKLSKADIGNILNKNVFENHRQMLNELSMKHRKQLNSGRILIENIRNDKRSAEDLCEKLSPLAEKAKQSHQEINKLMLKYFSGTKLGPDQKIKRSDLLGEGVFGKTYKATLTLNENARQVALKESYMSFDDEALPIYMQHFERMKLFQHENVARIYGHSFAPNDTTDMFQILREFSDESLDQKLNESNFFHVIPQLCSGIQYIHEECEYVHLGVKLENCLIFKDRVLKLADPAFYRSPSSLRVKGSPIYMAPEIWEQKMASYPADIYSLGIVMWEVWNKKRAYETLKDVPDPKLFILQGHRPSVEGIESNENLKALINQCWKQNPANRLDIRKISDDLSSLKID